MRPFPLLLISTFLGLASSGNYVPCSVNNCALGANCLVMVASPSPIQAFGDEAFRFSRNLTEQERARDFCRDASGRGHLIDPEDEDLWRSAKGFLTREDYESEGAQYYWTDEACTLFKYPCMDLIKDCNVSARAFCVDAHVAKAEDSPVYYYSCQCPDGYGGENCTLSTGEDGFTYCVQSHEEAVTTISTPPLSGQVLFIDHAVFGRPFAGELSSTSATRCPSELFAANEEQYCVASNTLAAVIYWCQGKQECTFSHSMITDIGDGAKNFFRPNRKIGNFGEAQRACADSVGGARVASPTTKTQLRNLLSEMTTPCNVDEERAFWMLASLTEAQDSTDFEMELEEDSSGDCLIMLEKSTPERAVLRHVPCSSSFLVVCEFTFGASGQASSDTVDDHSCLAQVDQTIFEHRFHTEELGTNEVACPMTVDYRRSNTCYKLTDSAMSWREARRKCWSWGGELAFPLDQESPECSWPIFSNTEEESLTFVEFKFNGWTVQFLDLSSEGEPVWIASTESCVGGPRCAISFADSAFIENSYFTSNDLCFPGELGVGDSQPRRGLCALAPSKTPRTQLAPMIPTAEECQPVPDDDQWDYEEFNWADVTGTPGETSYKPCPKDQSGNITWLCGYDGEWVGNPDLTDCTTIDVTDALNELDMPDSVPANVVGDVHEEINQQEELAPGDIDSVISVVDKALEVQNQRLAELLPSQQEQYSTSFTDETIQLLDDLLARPIPWQGIKGEEKSRRLTDIQANVDELADSLMQYSMSPLHEFSSPNNVLKLQVLNDVDTRQEQAYYDGASSIIINAYDDEDPDGQAVNSISFQSYATIGCILAEKSDCDAAVSGPTSDVVNSVVLGATLYDDQRRTLTKTSGVKVVLTFAYEYTEAQYNISDVTCGFWDLSLNTWSTSGCLVISSDGFSSTCECDHLTNFAVLLDINGNLEGESVLNCVLTWITVVGCTLSIIALVACIYVFTFVRGLRGERTTIHRNLCICLLVSEIILLSGLDATSNSAVCAAVAAFLHFFFLAAFAWMLVEGVHVYNMLVKVFDSARSPLWRYYIIGYGSPAAIVGLSVAIVEATGTHGYGTENNCWLDYENGLIWAFAAPVLLVLSVNSVMFVKALLIARRTINRRHNVQETKNILTLVRGSFSLLCILGLTWGLGFFYFFDGSEWLSVVFALLNSLQGVFILSFHVILNDKARKEVVRAFRKTVRMARSAINREPYESSTGAMKDSADLGPSGQSKGTTSQDTAATLSTDVKTISSASEGAFEEAQIKEESVDNNANATVQTDEVRYVRGGVTMTIIEKRKIIRKEQRDVKQSENVSSPDYSGPTFFKERDISNSSSDENNMTRLQKHVKTELPVKSNVEAGDSQSAVEVPRLYHKRIEEKKNKKNQNNCSTADDSDKDINVREDLLEYNGTSDKKSSRKSKRKKSLSYSSSDKDSVVSIVAELIGDDQIYKDIERDDGNRFDHDDDDTREQQRKTK